MPLTQAVTARMRLVPVTCGSSYRNKGVQKLLDAIVDYMPAPTDIPAIVGTNPKTDQEEDRHASDDEPFSALAFKIMTDPYVGRLSFFRVYSGTLNTGSSVLNATKGKRERVGRLLQMHANHREDLETVYSGDIAAVREEFLPQYYLNGETVPKTIAVDALPPDAEALNEALTQARGTKVELYVPQRGDVAKLVTMAYTNAVERLGRESGRYTREQKLLEEAAQVLGLKAPPRVIESYDISNWGDGSSVCGMVVFMDGKPHRSGYRRFKMKTVAGTDDYASLAETLSRRAAEYEAARRGEKPDGPQNQFATLPDLLLIDGGKGQVGAVKQALRGTALEHVPTFGMVKDDHHRTRAIVDDEGGEIAINRNRNIFTFVTNIQDETHRYANDYRKRAMKKKSYAATLTAIPGVGEKTSAALLAHFKTVAAVKAASISDLEEVKGISHAKAEMLYNALRNGV